MKILRRLSLWVRTRKLDADVREEMEFHRGEIQRGLEDRGMNTRDAVHESRRRMGNVTLAREDVREIWIWRWLDAGRQDVRYALRAFRRYPSFSVPAFITLALGIGANAAIFSIVDGAILRPLPYHQAERLVQVRLHNRLTAGLTESMLPRDFLDWRARNRVFDAVAMEGGGRLTLLNNGEPEQLRVARVTSDFLDVMRVRPLRGRTFTAREEEPGNDKVAMLSYEFWRQRFGGSPDAVGRVLICAEGSYQIVGVLPADFSDPPGSRRPIPLFVPMSFDAQDRQFGIVQSSSGGQIIGRLRDGVTMEQAAASLSELQYSLDQQHVGFNKGWSIVELRPLLDSYVEYSRTWMLLLLGAVGCVLLIACANVANLFIAHSTARARELTIRGSLGAARGRIAGQLMVETMLIALAGGIAGVMIGWVTLNVFRASLPSSIPRSGGIALDLRVLTAMAAVVIATGLVCGVLPAFQASRLDLVDGLKQGGGHSATAGRSPQRMRYSLAWCEITLATLLLAVAALLVTSFTRLLTVDKGFDPTGVVAFQISLPNTPGISDDIASAHAKAEFGAILAAVRARPGIEAAINVTGSAPFEGGYTLTPFHRSGEPGTPAAGTPGKLIELQRISDGFFELLRIPIRAGRSFSVSDTDTSQPVVIVNEAAVKELWGGRNPIGDRIQIAKLIHQVVGVVGDIRYRGPAAAPSPQAFVPYRQSYAGGGNLLVRGRADVIPLVKAAVWSVDPTLPFPRVATADKLFDAAITDRRFNMELVSIFALLALAIAATGVYGVLAFAMNQRRREIGIRLALGAQPTAMVAGLLGNTGLVIGGALIAGLGASWALSRTIESFLFEVNPRDPLLYGAVAAVIAFVAITAAWLPARRAAAVDPLTVLREE